MEKNTKSWNKLNLGIKSVAILSLVLAFAGTALAGLIGYIDTKQVGDRYAWGENVGFVDFGLVDGGVVISDSGLSGFAWGENIGWIDLSGVENDGLGNLSGYAWGENVGFINFSGVQITTGGKFEGQAWGENIGYLLFGRDNILLATDWVPRQGRGQDGGSRIGTPSPPADEERTGGGQGGGEEVLGKFEEPGVGENIAYSPDIFFPTATGDIYNGWINPEDAFLSDFVLVANVIMSEKQSYHNFNFNIPENSQILGIEVKLDARNSQYSPPGFIKVKLSGDGGSTWSNEYMTPELSTGSDRVEILGSGNDLWGKEWAAEGFNNNNFRLLITSSGSDSGIALDAIAVRVYHELGGGGEGGVGAL